MNESLGMTGAAAALGIGMLIGLERERHKGTGERRGSAGLRTFAISALLGYAAMVVGAALLVGIVAIGLTLLITVAYWRGRDDDPGVTSEVALIIVLILGALCTRSPELAVAIGVVVAGLLTYREKLHDFAITQLSETEMRDGLILLITALVVLPLTPDRYIGPYAALNLRTICTLTVLLMLVGAGGHIAVRTLGIRYGYVLSAIASGFASSTVTIATMGHRLAREPANLRILSAAALLSNLATMVQTGLILATVDPALLRNMWLPLVCGSVATLIYSACLMLPDPPEELKDAVDRRCIQFETGLDRCVDHDRDHPCVIGHAQSIRPNGRDAHRHLQRFRRCARVYRLDRRVGQGRSVTGGGDCRSGADRDQQQLVKQMRGGLGQRRQAFRGDCHPRTGAADTGDVGRHLVALKRGGAGLRQI